MNNTERDISVSGVGSIHYVTLERAVIILGIDVIVIVCLSVPRDCWFVAFQDIS
jgi:hypothetical protein